VAKRDTMALEDAAETALGTNSLFLFVGAVEENAIVWNLIKS
jgi:hypothetical protein